MSKVVRYVLLAGTVLVPAPSPAQTAAPPDASLYFIYPRTGMKVRSPFTVRFGLRNMGVTHAGDTTPNMGHHHLLVDVTDPISPTEPLPSNKKYLHFGAGQTETQMELPPGGHTMQLVLGDAEHKPFKPLIASPVIRIRVLRPPLVTSNGSASR